METRNVKLSLDKARRFYSRGGELREWVLSVFTEDELTNQLPKTWDEYAKKSKAAVFYISFGMMKLKDSEAHTALCKLHHLRDYYRQGWQPNYADGEIKYSVISVNGNIRIHTTIDGNHFLTFQTLELAEKFMNNFKDLIKYAGDLI